MVSTYTYIHTHIYIHIYIYIYIYRLVCNQYILLNANIMIKFRYNI